MGGGGGGAPQSQRAADDTRHRQRVSDSVSAVARRDVMSRCVVTVRASGRHCLRLLHGMAPRVVCTAFKVWAWEGNSVTLQAGHSVRSIQRSDLANRSAIPYSAA